MKGSTTALALMALTLSIGPFAAMSPVHTFLSLERPSASETALCVGTIVVVAAITAITAMRMHRYWRDEVAYEARKRAQ